MGDFLICMGSSIGTACGFSKATDKKVISYIGDSTFFHSGIPGLVNAVFNNHNFTLVILDNGTTAMTGHQPHPGVDMARMNLNGFGRVSIEKVVKAVGRSARDDDSSLSGQKKHRDAARSHRNIRAFRWSSPRKPAPCSPKA